MSKDKEIKQTVQTVEVTVLEEIRRLVHKTQTHMASLDTNVKHLETYILSHGQRLDHVESKVQKLELANVELRGFGRDIKAIQSTVEGLDDSMQRLVRSNVRNSFVLDGGTRVFWIVMSNIAVAVCAFLLAKAMGGS